MIETRTINLGDSKRILIFTDLHAHEYKPFTKPLPDGVSSRLWWVTKTLETIVNYAKDNGINHIFFLGDMFHHRTLLYNIVFYQICKVIDQAYENGIEFHLILGNHDYIYNSDDAPSVVNRIRNVNSISRPVHYLLEGFQSSIACTPFRFDTELQKRDITILNNQVKNKMGGIHLLLGHFELYGAKINDEYVLSSPISSDIFDNTVFTHFISGHIHKRQLLETKSKQINFVGVPIQHRFSDEGNRCCFYVCDFQESSLQPIELATLDHFPEFKTVELRTQDEIKDFMKENQHRFNLDYYRVRAYAEGLKLDVLLKKLENFTYEYFGPVVKKTDDSTKQPRFNLDIGTYLNRYIEENPANQDFTWVDRKDLLVYLESLLLKANICQK